MKLLLLFEQPLPFSPTKGIEIDEPAGCIDSDSAPSFATIRARFSASVIAVGSGQASSATGH